jgi:hypothetical protein
MFEQRGAEVHFWTSAPLFTGKFMQNRNTWSLERAKKGMPQEITLPRNFSVPVKKCKKQLTNSVRCV